MGDGLPPREVYPRPRRESAAAAFYQSAHSTQKHDNDVTLVETSRENHGGPERLPGDSGRIAGRRLSGPPLVVHQRHMPKGTQKFHIPRKTKEKLALFQPLSCESREYEDMMTVLTSGYLDPASSDFFSYNNPRLIHSEALEKEFVEKRKELKADGRTDKELEESYCFLLTDSSKLQTLCEKGLFVAQSWVTVLGNPSKGVYLSRCSDLLSVNPFTPGATGEIIIFKVIKGKVKSIYENMKNLLDPTPRFDSHLSKNISKITSLGSYRAYELTQHYFYEYSFDELRQRPRQVCPYAVVSFQFKDKDTPLTNKPLAPLRLNSQSTERSQEHAQYTVWSGDLVKDGKVLFQISLRSSSPPFLPHKLPEKLEMKWLMRWDQATRRLPESLFSYNLYNSSSQEVEKDGHCCSLLEVVDRTRSTTSVTKLLQELETKRVVLVMPLTESGFLFLLSSVQMALPHERGENWKRTLQALFVFPESRQTKSTVQSVPSDSSDTVSADSVMPGLNQFVPALHFALGKARANPPPDLSTGVEQQAKEYLTGIKAGALRPYPMGHYEAHLEQGGRQYPVPKHHRLSVDTTLRSYLSGPARYLLLLSRVRLMVQALCPKDRQDPGRKTQGEAPHHKMQQLIDLVLACKRDAEKEVEIEMKSGARKRRLEQETAQRTIKHLKASQELRHLNAPQQHGAAYTDTTEIPASPGSLTSLIGSVGLKDTDLREEGSELASKLLSLLTSLNQKATNHSVAEPREEEQRESSPFNRLAVKLGLPTNTDIDLRKQDELEEQMGASVSSSEGFSPSSHSGELNYHLRPAHRDRDRDRDQERDPRRRKRPAPVICEEEKEQEQQPDIPWILIPITGLCSERYTHRDTELPQDPRFQHLVSTTTPTSTTSSFPLLPAATVSTATTTTSPIPPSSPAPSCSSSLDPSPPASPSQCPSPDPSSPSSHCPSPQPGSSPEHHREALTDTCGEPSEAFNDPQTEEEIPDSRDTPEASPEISAKSPSPVPCSSSAQLSPTLPSPSKHLDSEDDLPDILNLEPISPPLRLHDIDSIIDRHLDSFSSDVQLILQNQGVNSNLRQSPHSTSQPSRPSPSSLHTPVTPFSQFVSFYHPCSPVNRYVSSLREKFNAVLTRYENNLTPNRPDTTTATPDLASKVSEFVASIRAANDDSETWQCDTQRDVSSSMDCDEREVENDVTCIEGLEKDIDSFGDAQNISNSRRQVQFGSNNLEISIRNDTETHSSSSREVKGVGESDLDPVSPPFQSDTNSLNSLINQLQPEVFTNLVEIIKDLKRNAQHFYIHCTETDHITDEIRAQLLNQSYIAQSPATLLNQENSSGKFLVVIKNQDISAHIHQIPELMSLKKRPSVVFVGVDKAEDVLNHSFCELFVSGGQVVSDEMVLNPDYVSHDKLAALLSVLEQHSSSENVWRWKVHCKAHKKLKEQARFRRDAASLLDVLLSYQKRQIVEFLPYHKCDMSQGCELMDCVLELQGRYTSFRHTILLTENRLVNSSGGGVIVCGIEEFLHDFTQLVGYNDNNKEPITDEPQSTEDPAQLSPVPSMSDPPLPESSSIPLHSEQDFEVLHRAISQLRAERQKQLQGNQVKDSDNQETVSTTVSTTEPRSCTPPADKVQDSESVQLTPGRKAVAATLELIHSSLHPREDRTNMQTTIQPIRQPRVEVTNKVTKVEPSNQVTTVDPRDQLRNQVATNQPRVEARNPVTTMDPRNLVTTTQPLVEVRNPVTAMDPRNQVTTTKPLVEVRNPVTAMDPRNQVTTIQPRVEVRNPVTAMDPRNQVTTIQPRVEVKNQVATVDSRKQLTNKVTTIQPRVEARNLVTTIDPGNQVTTIQPRVEVKNQVATVDSRDQQPRVEARNQVTTVQPREVPMDRGGSVGSVVTSEPRGAVEIPAACSVRPPQAPNMNQSNVRPENSTAQTTSSSPADISRTKKKKKENEGAEDAASVSQAKKPNTEYQRTRPKCLLLADAKRRVIEPWKLVNPNVWDTITIIREGFLPTRTPIAPINDQELAQWTAQSEVRAVLNPVCKKKHPKGWWPARITVYDSDEGPWAVVAKVDQETNSTTPVCLLIGQYTQMHSQASHRQFQEDRCDMVMYF